MTANVKCTASHALTIILCIFSVSCRIVPNLPHQMTLNPPAVLFSTEPNEKGYRFAAIEFDDAGDIFDIAQRDAAVAEISAANADAKRLGDVGRGAMVILFIHGWKHNAKETDANLLQFRQTMAALVREESEFIAEHNRTSTAPPWHVRPYVGIYIGWRGDTLNFMPTNTRYSSWMQNVSYYGRNAAASRVGGVTAIEMLSDLFHAAKDGSPETLTIAIGHSMGGLILEQSMMFYLAASLKDLTWSKRAGDVPQSFRPADLVVLVNQASPAIRAQHFINLLDRAKIHSPLMKNDYTRFLTADQLRRGPLVIAVTSTKDVATGSIFTYAQSPLARSITERDARERYLLATAAGHAIPLWSHALTVTNTPEWSNNKPATIALANEWEPIEPCDKQLWHKEANTVACFAIGKASSPVTDRVVYRLTETSPPTGPRNATPYWIVPVPPTVIANHGDIFNAVFRGFIRGLVHYTTEGGIPRLEAPAAVRPEPQVPGLAPTPVPLVPEPLKSPVEPESPVPKAFPPATQPHVVAEYLILLLREYHITGMRESGDDWGRFDQELKRRIFELLVRLRYTPAVNMQVHQADRCSWLEVPPIRYEVRPGDWLSKLALRFYGDAQYWGPIFAANRKAIANPDSIYPRQRLAIPCPVVNRRTTTQPSARQ